MKTQKIHTNYIKWLSAEDMHIDSKEWLLELSFLNDEYLFFEDLIKWNTLQLIDLQPFSKSKLIAQSLSNALKTNTYLIKLVKKHEKDLEILVDGVYQLNEDQEYKKEHKKLIILFKNHLKEHRELKLSLFDVLKKIKKIEKQKKLIELE